MSSSLAVFLTCIVLGALAPPAAALSQFQAALQFLSGTLEQQPLFTYFLDINAPNISIDPDEPREGVTRATLKLKQGSVNPSMPVIAASKDPGLVHSVTDTWDWLQVRLADLFGCAESDRQHIASAVPYISGNHCSSNNFGISCIYLVQLVIGIAFVCVCVVTVRDCRIAKILL